VERPSCSKEDVESLVREFLQFFNAGDLIGLDRLFASDPDFRWYSVEAPGERFQCDAYDRSTLIAYFNTRHKSGERLTLRRFRFNGSDQNFGHFGAKARYRRSSRFRSRRVTQLGETIQPTRWMR
jgi:hypothetical protein